MKIHPSVILGAITAISQNFDAFDRQYIGKSYMGTPIESKPPKCKAVEAKKRRDKRARRAKRGY